MLNRIRLALLFTLFVNGSVFSQTRERISLNDSWAFAKGKPGTPDTSGLYWQPVTLPHSWNTSDVMDDEPGYYRGIGWYKRKLKIPGFKKGRVSGLYFDGANQLTTVYIDGRKAAAHTGGYTGFYVSLDSIDPLVAVHEILVSVDNSYNADIPPLTADFTFFGGLYRNVWLISADPVHFTMGSDGATAVVITTPSVNAAAASVRVQTQLENRSAKTRKLTLRVTVRDAGFNVIAGTGKKLQLLPGKKLELVQDLKDIRNPHLWSPDDPYLYSVTTSVMDEATGEVLDELVYPVGFRWFRFDAAEGFFLNGKPLKLVGASRHQDRPGVGNAVPDGLAREDVRLLKEMGGNFLRVAHYPQDPSVLEECDRLGIIASVEIPLVNEISETKEFYSNSANMLREMIAQNRNHPSVVIWCLMNEILLKPHFNNDKSRQLVYFATIVKLASALDSIARTTDPYRYTMIANHGDFDRYHNSGLTKVAMITGWNLYSGWYGGELKNFSGFLDKHHERLPGVPLIVSEYGADADPRIRSFTPVKFDKSVEYSLAFHQYYLNEMLKRPFCAAAIIWNLADFNSETREETMPHINNKGMLRWDRTPKDLYHYYQAKLLKEPFVSVMSRTWTSRTGIAEPGKMVCRQRVDVASNADTVMLSVNGVVIGTASPVDGICSWLVDFKDGENKLDAVAVRDGHRIRDYARIHFQLQPYLLKDSMVPFRSMNILLGARRIFIDELLQENWMPDQPYRTGSWGSVGGKAFRQSGNGRLPYGTDKNITGTDNDPVYQTQQTGLSAYRLDLPNGQYEITLHFAELEGVSGANLVYNLSDGSGPAGPVERVFDVKLNGRLFLQDFNIALMAGPAKAIAKKTTVVLSGGKGLVIDFIPKKGEPVLNAIQVRKL